MPLPGDLILYKSIFEHSAEIVLLKELSEERIQFYRIYNKDSLAGIYLSNELLIRDDSSLLLIHTISLIQPHSYLEFLELNKIEAYYDFVNYNRIGEANVTLFNSWCGWVSLIKEESFQLLTHQDLMIREFAKKIIACR